MNIYNLYKLPKDMLVKLLSHIQEPLLEEIERMKVEIDRRDKLLKIYTYDIDKIICCGEKDCEAYTVLYHRFGNSYKEERFHGKIVDCDCQCARKCIEQSCVKHGIIKHYLSDKHDVFICNNCKDHYDDEGNLDECLGCDECK